MLSPLYKMNNPVRVAMILPTQAFVLDHRDISGPVNAIIRRSMGERKFLRLSVEALILYSIAVRQRNGWQVFSEIVDLPPEEVEWVPGTPPRQEYLPRSNPQYEAFQRYWAEVNLIWFQ